MMITSMHQPFTSPTFGSVWVLECENLEEMAFGRSKRVVKYDEFVNRIRKSFYFGGTSSEDDLQLSLPLASYASELFSKPHKDYSLNRLSTYHACKIQASPCSLIMAFIFLERLNSTDPSYVRRITPHELFIVSMMISTKFYVGYDEEIYLSDWAAEGNMTEDRLKQLELEFLCAINWKIYISNEEFFKKLNSVEKSLAQREGFGRGWLTYTELLQIMPSLTLAKYLLHALFNHIAVMVVSYAAGILTIVGACFLASQIPGHMLHKGNRSGPSSTILASDNAIDPVKMAAATNNETILNGTDLSVNAETSMATVIARHNATCNALNVEAELLRLERNYREEKEAEELLNRNNELNNVNYKMLLPFELSRVPLKFTKLEEHKWLIFKETYSERHRHRYNSNAVDSDNQKTAEKQDTSKYEKRKHHHIYEYFKNFENSTSSYFWQMLSETAQAQSFIHLPSLWFKFI